MCLIVTAPVRRQVSPRWRTPSAKQLARSSICIPTACYQIAAGPARRPSPEPPGAPFRDDDRLRRQAGPDLPRGGALHGRAGEAPRGSAPRRPIAGHCLMRLLSGRAPGAHPAASAADPPPRADAAADTAVRREAAAGPGRAADRRGVRRGGRKRLLRTDKVVQDAPAPAELVEVA